MKKRLLSIALTVIFVLSLCSCAGKGQADFCIQFIDVGQGDSALVECEGHYMLIDGGDDFAGDKVYDVLSSKGVENLDILTISHLHDDHIRGLERALEYPTSIGLVLGNTDSGESKAFLNVKEKLNGFGAPITVPSIGQKFNLGSAEIEVIDVANEKFNDSLVLLISYGETSFLFMGDTESEEQDIITERVGEAYKVNLIKMPHHGAADLDSENGPGALYRLIKAFSPAYAVISVGANNNNGVPNSETLEILEMEDVNVIRTDLRGDIIVRSNGKKLTFETSK